MVGSANLERGKKTERILIPVAIGISVIVLAGMILPMFSRSRQSTKGHYTACRNNLKQLIFAEMAYADDHDGRFSEKLSDLYPEYVTHLDIFRCPSAGGPEITKREDIDSLTTYILRKGLTTASPPDEVLIYENPSNHGEDDEYAAFVSGDVRRLTQSEIRGIIEKDRPDPQ